MEKMVGFVENMKEKSIRVVSNERRIEGFHDGDASPFKPYGGRFSKNVTHVS